MITSKAHGFPISDLSIVGVDFIYQSVLFQPSGAVASLEARTSNCQNASLTTPNQPWPSRWEHEISVPHQDRHSPLLSYSPTWVIKLTSAPSFQFPTFHSSSHKHWYPSTFSPSRKLSAHTFSAAVRIPRTTSRTQPCKSCVLDGKHGSRCYHAVIKKAPAKFCIVQNCRRRWQTRHSLEWFRMMIKRRTQKFGEPQTGISSRAWFLWGSNAPASKTPLLLREGSALRKRAMNFQFLSLTRTCASVTAGRKEKSKPWDESVQRA